MRVCERWLANDYLTRHGQPTGQPCGHDPQDCPPIAPHHNPRGLTVTRPPVRPGGPPTLPAEQPAPTATDQPEVTRPERWKLPDGIEWELVRWRCVRCEKRSTWVTGDLPDDAVAEAWRHHADHEQWAAERLAAPPREESTDA
jgi:hypothetical protein